VSHSHGPGHVHTSAAGQKGRLALVLALSSAVLVVELVGGAISNSLALFADAAHMFTDVAGIALALVAVKFAERPATPARTYGYYRVEILAALVNSVVLGGVSLVILYEAYTRIVRPESVATGTMIVVALLGIAANAASAYILHAGSSQSLNIKSAYFEVFADMLASAGVLLAAFLTRALGWVRADPAISCAIALFILPRTWHLLRETVSVLLEGTPSEINLAALRQALNDVPGIASIHDLHVWTLTSGVNALSVHAVLEEGASHRGALDAARDRVARDFKIRHATIQVEELGCEHGETHL
jgi:cobalt-zinc-cadmium efflux system protein